jgi:phosphatidylinositol glycan class N
VADGLRADRFFEMDPHDGRSRAPFLRGIIERRGCFGVSHTRVPTESRPGHVALFGGIYEDVSAVTRGWTHNPVKFDTIFNRSLRAWGLGSPDIVPMFSESVPQMDAFVYNADAEVFDGDSNGLDSWVFDKWLLLLKNESLVQGAMQQPRSVHFLHLLALDTHGHTFKPNSLQYIDTIRRVDAGIERAVSEMEARFPDGRTAYLFTSDHGMSDKGSHGAGDPSETETPYVAWGAGIRGPLPASTDSLVSPRSWEVDHLLRLDIEQADVAPWVATLLGMALPSNSVGRLPTGCLLENSYSILALQANAAQLIELLRVKHELRRDSSVVWFRPSPALADAQGLLAESRRSNSVKLASEALETARSGLSYYDTYDRAFLYALISVAMIGWVLILAAGGSIGGQARYVRVKICLLQSSVFCVLCLVNWLDKAPWMYYVYAGAAAGIGVEGLFCWRTLLRLPLGWVVLLECFVVGFFWRPVFSVLSLVLAAAAGLSWMGSTSNWFLCVGFSICALFPLIPPSFGASLWMVVAGGALCGVLSKNSVSRIVFGLATLNCLLESRVASWIILFVCAARWFLDQSLLWDAVAPVFLLLSIAYEPILLGIIWFVLQEWEQSEWTLLHGQRDASASYRRGFVYIFLAYLSFFGTGNTGSLSSFDPSSTYRFAVVFNPFLMGGLLGLKLILPVLLAGRVFARVSSEEDSLFSLMIMCDVIAFSFFFLVRDQGSWREIGETKTKNLPTFSFFF